MRKILGISGSLRKGSSNEQLILNAARLAPATLEVHLYQGIDRLPFFHPDQDTSNTPQEAEKFRKTVASSAGLLISSPEYAHGIPGVLKNALDWLVGSPEFEGKSIAIFCGGDYAPNQLEEVLRTMSAKILKKVVLSAPSLRSAFDDHGNLVNATLLEELNICLRLFDNDEH